MKVAGMAVLQASPDQVWEALRDPAVLGLSIPGCRDVQRVGDGTYRVWADVAVASIAGACDGRVEVSPIPADRSCAVRVTAAGEPGTIAGTVTLELVEDEPGGTQVRYHGDAVVGGALGAVGQRVLVSAAQRNAAQFFEAVDRCLAGEEEPTPEPPLHTHDVLADPLAPPPPPSHTRQLLLAGLAGAVIAVFVMVLARRNAPTSSSAAVGHVT
jgi:hypothetical protein